MRMFKACALLVMVVTAAGCDRAQLLAPTSSTITVSAATRVLPTGGSTEVTAFVLEQSGTPVQNGTIVRFTTTLGRVDPQEAQTRNGLAIATFFAGTSSGVAQVRAISGGAGGSTSTGTGTTATTTTTNVVEITIGAAAASRITLTATPSSVSSSGGTSQITASVADTSGNALPGVLVVFSTDAGSLSTSSATTDSSGRAIVLLATNRASKVTARVGAGTGTNAITAEITVGANVQGTVTLTCAGIAAAGASCSQVVGQTVTFTAGRGTTTGAASIASARLDFGDGSSVNLGNLASTTTVNHVYQGDGTRTATLTATDSNGETTAASVSVTITSRPPLSVTFTATAPTTPTLTTARWTFAADPREGTTDAKGQIKVYRWNFDDADADPSENDEAETSGASTSHVYGLPAGRRVVTLEIETVDGRKATAREEIVVTFGTTAP